MTIKRLLQRALPPWAVDTVRALAGYRLFYRQRATLPSGVAIEVRSHPDWVVFNEVFVNGEYDRAIRDAIRGAAADRPFRVLDLGANTGFFTLRTLDLVRQTRPELDVRILAVEGSRSTHRLLERRTRAHRAAVTTVCGLVGERSGAARFAEYPSTTTNTLFQQPLTAREVSFVDLDALLPPGTHVDLIKCDIEGAEGLFLATYGDLLRRTAHVAIELHGDLVDVEACRAALAEAGLRRVHVASERDTLVVENWSRWLAEPLPQA